MNFLDKLQNKILQAVSLTNTAQVLILKTLPVSTYEVFHRRKRQNYKTYRLSKSGVLENI